VKKIIVTGATGMIGAFLVALAAGRGVEVLAVARKGSPKIGNIVECANVKIIECDMDGFKDLRLPDGSYDTFYHFAWGKTYGAQRNDAGAQLDNIRYTLDAVELARRAGCDVFVGAGSQAEYGTVKDGVLSPDTPADPKTGYGIAKYAAGKMSRLLCGQYGIRHCWGRILSAYGPMDNGYTLIMYCVREFLSGKVPSLTKCDQLWDYIYGEDVAEAFYLMGEKGRDGSTYCIGSGETRRLRDYVEVIRDMTDKSLDIGFGDREYYPDQVMKMQADIRPLSNDTGFSAGISFEEGIKRTIDWCKRETKI